MKWIGCLLLVLCSVSLSAQDVHALVYFTDKPNVTTSLASPVTILTQRAIQRKARHNIAIDVRDVPMNQSYVQQIKSTPGITYHTQSKWFNCVHVTGTPAQINSLANNSFVSAIEFADPTLRQTEIRTAKFETQVSTPLNYGNATTQISMIGLDQLHNQNFTGSGMLIAVTDSGFPSLNINSGFNQLRNNNGIAGGYDFVDGDATYIGDHWHGTRVLSIMAGNDPNNFEGSAPDAQYLLFRTEDAQNETPVEMSYWVAAAERADSLGVDVMNVSLGYLTFDNPAANLSYNDMDGQTAFISRGAQVAVDKGMVVVAAAGNSGSSSTHPYIAAPADAAGVFSIGAVDGNQQRTSFSSTGPTIDGRIKPDVMAMGGGTALINESQQLTNGNGTSYSSPLISGGIACLMQAFPQLTPQQVMNSIRASASQSNAPDQLMGYGIPDFGVVFQTLSSSSSQTADINFYISNRQLYIGMDEILENDEIQIIDLLGKQVLRFENNENDVYDISTISSGIYILRVGNQTLKIAVH